jgi:hypothetical protein
LTITLSIGPNPHNPSEKGIIPKSTLGNAGFLCNHHNPDLQHFHNYFPAPHLPKTAWAGKGIIFQPQLTLRHFLNLFEELISMGLSKWQTGKVRSPHQLLFS